MAVVNSFAKFYGAKYPDEDKVDATAPTYGDAINILNGTLDVTGDPPVFPSQNDVRLGTTYGTTSNPTQFTGTVRVPPVERVEEGYAYDANDTLIGELVAQELVLPDITDVRSLVEYGDVVGGNPLVGVLGLPIESQVLAGVGYGAYFSEFEGTLTDLPGGGGSVQPPVLGNGGLRSPLIIGDRYEKANGKAFIWTFELWDGFDAVAATATLSGSREGCCNVDDWVSTGEIVDNGDGTHTVTFELTAEQTAAIPEGEHDWSVSIDDTTMVSSATHGTVEWICL